MTQSKKTKIYLRVLCLKGSFNCHSVYLSFLSQVNTMCTCMGCIKITLNVWEIVCVSVKAIVYTAAGGKCQIKLLLKTKSDEKFAKFVRSG